MSVRRALALVLALPLALAGSVALPSGAVASGSKTIVPLDGRFGGRCPPGNKELARCHDVLVLDSTGRTANLQFQLKKTYCSAVKTEKAGVWSYYPTIKRSNGVYRDTYVYHSMTTDDVSGAIALKFTLSGHFTSPSTFVLTVVGKVTKTVDDTKDCANVKFTEQHVLNYVKY